MDFEEDYHLAKAGKQATITSENLKIWREENLKTRDRGSQENNALVLGWDYGDKQNPDSIATYTIQFLDTLNHLEGLESDSLGNESSKQFFISIAAGSQNELQQFKSKEQKKNKPKKESKPPQLDFTIRLTDWSGREIFTKVSTSKPITPPLKVQFTKLKSLDSRFGSNWEVHLESFFFPIDAFENSASFDINQLKAIKFIFDQTPEGIVVVDEIGVM